MEPLLLGVVIAVGLACPLHMWWSHRRGNQAACCPPRTADDGLPDNLEDLRARRCEVEARLAEFDVNATRDVDLHGLSRHR